MDLYILRHGDAAQPGTTRDADRPLTAVGMKEINNIANGMRTMNLSFDAILTSPYRRARETAEIVGEVLECGSLISQSPNLVSDEDPAAITKEISQHYSRKMNILLVGHEPNLSALISVLISGSHTVSLKLKKGGLCKLSAESLRFGKCATLEWLMGPSQIVG